MLHRSSVQLLKLLSRNYFRSFPLPKSPFLARNFTNLSNECTSRHNFKQHNRFLRPESTNSASNFKIPKNYRRFSVEIDKEVDQINLKFAEAREEIESAMESKETVYFNEEADCARAAVSEVMELYAGLLEKLPEKERASIQRAMGLKIEQLKAELQQLNEYPSATVHGTFRIPTPSASPSLPSRCTLLSTTGPSSFADSVPPLAHHIRFSSPFHVHPNSKARQQMLGPTKFSKSSTNLIYLLQRSLTTVAAAYSAPPNPPTPVNEAHLLRVCTVLYQQQNSPDTKLHTNLTKTQFNLTHEFFLQVCNKFPYSWRPIYKFHQFSVSQPHFTHTPTTFNKILDIIGKSRNTDLFCDLCKEAGERRLVNIKTYIIALRTLAHARELKKCVEFFHLMNGFGYEYKIETFNKVIEMLCRNKLVEEAKYVVVKMRDWIKPDGVTYRCLIYGFCDVGDLIEASKVWNLMVDEGFDPDINAVEVMVETLFKQNNFDEGLKLFQSMRVRRLECLGLSTYRLVIKWLSKAGKIGVTYEVLEEMRKREINPDNEILGSIVYGLMSRGRVREAYKVFEEVENADISLYHGMIKGLLKLKKRGEATEVFREMVRRGCEPTMHTYVMLLQGHMGKRGRKGDDPLVNFDTIFVGGLVKAGKSLEATKYVERVMSRGAEVPRFDYNKFLHYFSNEEGVVMFESMAGKLREVGLFDLADILGRYGEKMATRDRRRNRENESVDEVYNTRC